MSGNEMTCIVRGGSECLHLREKQKHLDKLFTKLKAKATKLKDTLSG